MALLHRPHVAQLAVDVLCRWVNRATGLAPQVGDANQPRPGLPYVSVTFPRGRPSTGYRRLTEHSETLAEQRVTPTAALGQAVTLIVNGARVSLQRGAEDDVAFAGFLAAQVGWWLRGRCAVAADGADVVVPPLAPGNLLQLDVIENATLADADPGPPARMIERLYRATCRVQVLGGQIPLRPGEAGDGLDPYTIEAALREHLTDAVTRQELAGAHLRPHALPEGEPSYASSISGAKREARVSFDLEFGWTGWYREDAEPIVEAELGLNVDAGGGVVVFNAP